MEFSSVLNEKFRCTKSLAGTVCKERCVERVCQPPFNQPPFGNVLFCAYRLDVRWYNKVVTPNRK